MLQPEYLTRLATWPPQYGGGAHMLRFAREALYASRAGFGGDRVFVRCITHHARVAGACVMPWFLDAMMQRLLTQRARIPAGWCRWFREFFSFPSRRRTPRRKRRQRRFTLVTSRRSSRACWQPARYARRCCSCHGAAFFGRCISWNVCGTGVILMGILQWSRAVHARMCRKPACMPTMI